MTHHDATYRARGDRGVESSLRRTVRELPDPALISTRTKTPVCQRASRARGGRASSGACGHGAKELGFPGGAVRRSPAQPPTALPPSAGRSDHTRISIALLVSCRRMLRPPLALALALALALLLALAVARADSDTAGEDGGAGRTPARLPSSSARDREYELFCGAMDSQETCLGTRCCGWDIKDTTRPVPCYARISEDRWFDNDWRTVCVVGDWAPPTACVPTPVQLQWLAACLPSPPSVVFIVGGRQSSVCSEFVR